MNDYKIIDEYGCKIDYSYLNKVIDKTLEMEHVLSSNFSIVFINDEKMHELNKNYRNIDRETDVISFALEDGEANINFEFGRLLGDIYICVPKMKAQAEEYGHSETREFDFTLKEWIHWTKHRFCVLPSIVSSS